MLQNKLSLMGIGVALFAATPVMGTAEAAECSGPAEVANVSFMADWLPWASIGPMVAAQIGGYYAEEGIELEIMSPANPADPIKLVARERVNFSLTYVPEVLMSRETGIPVISVATTLRTLSSGLFFAGDAGITGPADLKGRTLGVGPKLDAQAYLGTILKAGGLTREDVNVVDPGYAHVPMLLAGRIDAAHGLTYTEGLKANEDLAAAGRPEIQWLLYRDFGVPAFYYQVIVTNENWAEANPNTVCRFMRATLKGVDDWLNKPDAALEQIATDNDQFTPEQHRKIYESSRSHWVGEDGRAFAQDASVWESARDWAIEQKLITLADDPNSFFTNAYLP